MKQQQKICTMYVKDNLLGHRDICCLKMRRSKMQKYKTIISPVLLYGFETLPLTLTHSQILQVLLTSVLLTHAFSPQVTDEYQLALYPFSGRIKSQCDVQ
jgi:hypothetical protein